MGVLTFSLGVPNSTFLSTMSLCCIGGVCIPYSAFVPFLVIALKWCLEQLARLGVLPDSAVRQLQTWLQLQVPSSSCCSNAEEGCDCKKTSSVESLEEWQSLVEKNPTVVCKFSANWCQPCKQIEPVYRAVANRYPDVPFVQVDMDELPSVASLYNVTLLPTFLVLKQGKKEASMRGIRNVEEFLTKHVEA